jgi:hypothetical protein
MRPLLIIAWTLCVIGILPGAAVDRDPVLDPVVSVLNTGTSLEVQPMVSADRRYVTLNGMRAGYAGMMGSFIENIRTLGAAPIDDRGDLLLGADWSGEFVRSGDDSGSPVEVELHLGADPGGRWQHPVIAIDRRRCDAVRRQVELTVTVRLPGEARRTLRGQVHEQHLHRTATCLLTADPTWRSLTGTCTGQLGDGTITLTRQIGNLPEAMRGTWTGTVTALRGELVRGGAVRCDLRLTDATAELLLADDQVVPLTVLSWQADSRRTVFLVHCPSKHPDDTGHRGLLAGVWDLESKRFGAWFDNGAPLSGPILFDRAADP